MDVPQSPRQVSTYLDRVYAHQRGIGGRITRLRPYICPFEELLRRIPLNSTVLDVGCGVGIMSALAAGPGQATRVLGFDISAKGIEIARGTQLPPGVAEFRVLPAGEFPSETFDVVLAIDVLHHVPPPVQHDFIGSLCKCVSPGGLLIFKDISPRPWWKAFANRLHDLVMARQWVHYRHEDIVSDWLQSRGGKIIESTRLDRLWYSHYLLVWRNAA